MAAVALTVSCSSSKTPDPSKVPDATSQEVARVEPLSWWIGMKTELQLMIQGPEV